MPDARGALPLPPGSKDEISSDGDGTRWQTTLIDTDQWSRIARGSRCRCAGSATTLMATILPPLMVRRRRSRSPTYGATTMPAAPSTRTACATGIRPRSILATACAPRISLIAPRDTAAWSVRTTISGASSASSVSKEPSREAARKASTTSR